MPANKGPKLEFYRGDSFQASFKIMSAGLPIDISGWSIKFMLKKDVADTDANALISTSATLTDPSLGLYTLELSPADTSIDTGSNFVYDLQHSYNGSYRMTISGKCDVKPDVRQGD